ncbi:hypothetical protein MIR68_004895 [Amoeboaphelidium protococcarum]|nr:hypothetical protein MIR68_004895 [Amoeboaphelidium protococcarum]KAI3653313.1 hypothetical protein MP228_001260 [Amoeboaphelidium protococcarum]
MVMKSILAVLALYTLSADAMYGLYGQTAAAPSRFSAGPYRSSAIASTVRYPAVSKVSAMSQYNGDNGFGDTYSKKDQDSDIDFGFGKTPGFAQGLYEDIDSLNSPHSQSAQSSHSEEPYSKGLDYDSFSQFIPKSSSDGKDYDGSYDYLD